MHKVIVVLMSFLIYGCLGVPEGVFIIDDFELERFQGKWYEIARLDHRFERGLSHVTAEYTLRDDGGVTVVNRGYSSEKNKWKDAKGKAFPVGESNVGHLKVSFFGPFYGTYAIFELGEQYEYAFVSGSKRSYLWFLSRTPTVSPELLDQFVERVKTLGYDTSSLIFVDHSPKPNM